MSTTEQAAASDTVTQPTAEEKARIIELQKQIREAEKAANAPNPASGYDPSFVAGVGKDTYIGRQYQEYQTRQQEAQKNLPKYQAEYNALVQKPGLADYAKSHPATQEEIQFYRYNQFAISAQPDRLQQKTGYDYWDLQRFNEIAEANKSKPLSEIVRLYNESPDPRKNAPNATIDYEATLAARQQGFNVGSGIVSGLAETYQKDYDKRFGEHNKIIELTENIYTGKLGAPKPAEPTKTISPANPRKTIQTGQPDSTFANPNYAKKGSDRYMGIEQQVHVLDSSLPVSRAELNTGPFQIEGQNATAAIFGIAPEKPRVLSEAQVASMSPAEIESYNRQVEAWNRYAGYVTAQSKAFIKAQKLVNQGKWQENKKDLLKGIQEAKDAGIKYITINTKTGVKTVPIEQAFYNIVSAKDVIGIGAVPNIPEGYALAGSMSEPVLIAEPRVIKQDITGKVTEETGFGIRPQYETKPGTGMDFLTLVGKKATELVSGNKDTIQGGLAALGQVGVETFGGLVNIERLGGKAFAEFINGTQNNGTENNTVIIPEIVQPETVPGVITSGLSTGAMAAAVTKNPSIFFSTATQAFQRAQALARRQGLLATIAQTTGYLAPFSPSAVIKAVPLRLVKVTVPVGRGLGLGTTAEIEAGTLARQLKFGYGETIGRLGIGKTEGLDYESEIARPGITKSGTFFVGIPNAEKIPLEKIVYPTSRGGYRITEGPSGVFMTRPQTLDELIRIGKLEPEGKTLILAQKESVPITGKIKDVPLRTTLTPTGREQPQASLLAGKETAKLEELVSKGQERRKERLPAGKGSVINQFFDIEPRQRRDLDVDLGLMKISLAKQISLGIKEAKRIAEGMNALYSNKPYSKLFPDYDETMWIGKSGNKDTENIILFRSEPGTISAKTTKASMKLNLNVKGLTEEQFLGYKNWHVTNPGEPYVFFFGHDVKRLFAATSKFEAQGWGARLGYSRSLSADKNILAIKIKKGAIIEKDVNIRGVTKEFDPLKPTVNPEDVDILTPNRAEWIILKKDVIEDIRSGQGSKPFGQPLKQASELYGENPRSISERINARKIYSKIKPDYDETMWIGKKESKRIEEGMNALYNQETTPERLFKWEGRSVVVTTKGKNPQKVIEFVTEKESLDYGKGFKSNPDIVFGAKVPHKVIQPGGKGTYKMLGYRFQGLRKTSSILELGGDMPKEPGQFLGVSKGREKDIRDNVEYLLTKASQTKNEKEAIKLKETAIITERFARSRGWWTEQAGIPTVEFAEVEPPNIITSISQGIQKGSGLGGGLAKSSLVSKPTTESDIEGITGKKEKASITSPSVGRQFERSIGTRSPALRSPGRITSVGSRSAGLRSVGSVASIGQPVTSVASPGIVRSTAAKTRSASSPAKPSPASKILPSPSTSIFESPSIPSPGSPSAPAPSAGLGFSKVTPLKPIKPEPPLNLETLEFQKTKPTTSLFPKPGSRTDRTKGNKPKLDAFVGNVSDVDIALGFNRKEITSGIKRSEKRYKKDIQFAYKRGGFKKLITQHEGSVLSKKKRSILERENKKEVKKQKRKTGGFF